MADLRHVHVVDEVDQATRAWGTKVAAGLLLERFFQNPLKHLGGGVEVERHVGHHEVIGQVAEFILHQHSFARSGVAHQHDWTPLVNQHVQEVADTRGLRRVHEGGLQVNHKHSIRLEKPSTIFKILVRYSTYILRYFLVSQALRSKLLTGIWMCLQTS